MFRRMFYICLIFVSCLIASNVNHAYAGEYWCQASAYAYYSTANSAFEIEHHWHLRIDLPGTFANRIREIDFAGEFAIGDGVDISQPTSQPSESYIDYPIHTSWVFFHSGIKDATAWNVWYVCGNQ